MSNIKANKLQNKKIFSTSYTFESSNVPLHTIKDNLETGFVPSKKSAAHEQF